MSMSLALSTCALFISLMKSVNGTQCLNTTAIPLFLHLLLMLRLVSSTYKYI